MLYMLFIHMRRLNKSLEKRLKQNRSYIRGGHWGLSGHAMKKKYKL